MFWFKKKKLTEAIVTEQINNEILVHEQPIKNKISFEEIKAYLIDVFFIKNNFCPDEVIVERIEELNPVFEGTITHKITVKLSNCDLNFDFTVNFYPKNRVYSGWSGRLLIWHLSWDEWFVNYFDFSFSNSDIFILSSHTGLPFIKPSIMVADAINEHLRLKTKHNTERLYSMGLPKKNKHIKAIRKAKQ